MRAKRTNAEVPAGGLPAAGARKGTIGPRDLTGISTIEILMVTAIILITSALAAPDLAGVIQASRERKDVLAIVEHFREARSLARSLLQPTAIWTEDQMLYIQPFGRDLRSYQAGDTVLDVTVQTSDQSLTFDPIGGTDQPFPTDVSIRTSSGQVHTLTIYPAIGVVRLK